MNAAEIARLALALVVLPGIVVYYRRLRAVPGQHWFMVALSAIYVSYVLTIVEGPMGSAGIGDLVNTLQHLMYAVAGIAALLAALKLRAAVVATKGVAR